VLSDGRLTKNQKKIKRPIDTIRPFVLLLLEARFVELFFALKPVLCLITTLIQRKHFIFQAFFGIIAKPIAMTDMPSGLEL